MQPRTEWIINVKISFSTESNKLPMIWLSERLVVWIRETRGCRALSSPPQVIDSCAVLTFWWWWLRELGPDLSTDSGGWDLTASLSLVALAQSTGSWLTHISVIWKYWWLYWCGWVDTWNWSSVFAFASSAVFFSHTSLLLMLGYSIFKTK